MNAPAQRPRPRVLVISADRLGAEMAGPAIRSYEIARALRPVADVTLAGLPGEGEPPGMDATVRYELRDPRALRAPIAAADAVIAQPPWPHIARMLRASGARLIFDAYDPEPLEVLEFLADRPPPLRRFVQTLTIDRVLDAFHMGHHIACASDKQRDLWLGAMVASGLVPPSSYDRDPSFLSTIDLVPFGVPAEPPRSAGLGPRDRFPAIGPNDEIVLWNGGLWSWLDAPTAIRAIHLLAERRPGVRLVFMGAGSQGPARRATDEARRLAGELGALDRSVFFNDRWVPYDQRGDWLLEANCALSTHVEHLETRFAFRTRILDCFWAGVPVVCTAGDELARLVGDDDLGATVPQSRPEAVADAVERVLERGREAYAPALAEAAARHRWELTTRPIARWVTAPGLPRRIGAGVARPAARSGRAIGFTAALRAMAATGMKWPSL
ncbi:MAG: glycosyltransferase family 4 protein [Solirubrobacteraceae bacterium]